MPETARDELEANLFFIANDTLDGAERREALAALADDAELQAGLALLRTIRDGVRTVSDGSPGELGLRRLMRDVRREKRRTQVRRVARPLLAVAAALALVVQSAAIWQLLDRPDTGGSELLSGAEAGRLQLRFAPEATASEIQALLQDAGARIVSGPSAMGLYKIEADDPDAALAALEARDDLVAFVDRE